MELLYCFVHQLWHHLDCCSLQPQPLKLGMHRVDFNDGHLTPPGQQWQTAGGIDLRRCAHDDHQITPFHILIGLFPVRLSHVFVEQDNTGPHHAAPAEPQQSAYAPQQAWIQNATLRDNITFGLPFELDKYMSVLEACALEADIAMLPAGDMTQVGEKGITLSGGQKQRVAIARALAGDPEIVLADEPTAALDGASGRAVLELLRELAHERGRAVVIVTHDSRALTYADRIVHIEDGKIEPAASLAVAV